LINALFTLPFNVEIPLVDDVDVLVVVAVVVVVSGFVVVVVVVVLVVVVVDAAFVVVAALVVVDLVLVAAVLDVVDPLVVSVFFVSSVTATDSFVFEVTAAIFASSLSICFSLTFVPEKSFTSVPCAAAGVTVAEAIMVAIINALLTHTNVIRIVINTLMLFFDVLNFLLILFSSRTIRFKIHPGNEKATVLGSQVDSRFAQTK